MMEELSVADGLRPNPGGPFSALTASMWPQEILAKLGGGAELASAGPNDQPEYRFDEFGFRVEEEDGPEQSSNKLLSIPFVEDPQQRLQWIAHLEFSHNKEATELTWEHVDVMLPRTEKLRNMVRQGIPHTLRAQMWMRLSGALAKKQKSETSYQDIVKGNIRHGKQGRKYVKLYFPSSLQQRPTDDIEADREGPVAHPADERLFQ